MLLAEGQGQRLSLDQLGEPLLLFPEDLRSSVGVVVGEEVLQGLELLAAGGHVLLGRGSGPSHVDVVAVRILGRGVDDSGSGATAAIDQRLQPGVLGHELIVGGGAARRSCRSGDPSPAAAGPAPGSTCLAIEEELRRRSSRRRQRSRFGRRSIVGVPGRLAAIGTARRHEASTRGKDSRPQGTQSTLEQVA